MCQTAGKAARAPSTISPLGYGTDGLLRMSAEATSIICPSRVRMVQEDPDCIAMRPMNLRPSRSLIRSGWLLSLGLSVLVHAAGTTALPSQMKQVTVPLPAHFVHAILVAPLQVGHLPMFRGEPPSIWMISPTWFWFHAS